MKLPKNRVCEYLGIGERTLSKLIREGNLKNYDQYNITLDSLIEYKSDMPTRGQKPIVQLSISSMRIEDNKTLVIDFTGKDALDGFIKRLHKHVRTKVVGSIESGS